jgi:adenosine deaminase
VFVDWAIHKMENGIITFGLGGAEIDNSPELFQETFKRVKEAGLPIDKSSTSGR